MDDDNAVVHCNCIIEEVVAQENFTLCKDGYDFPQEVDIASKGSKAVNTESLVVDCGAMRCDG